MKKFRIVSDHDIFIDDYEQGELSNVNGFSHDSIQKADTVQDAVLNHLLELCYTVDIKDVETSECGEFLQTSVTVNKDNIQPYESEINDWKQGKCKLYNDHVTISAEELISVKFN